jgi:hypothetical protein
MKRIPHPTLIVYSLLSVIVFSAANSAWAQEPPTAVTGAERFAADAEARNTEWQARQTIETLFGRLCPGRCELVSVRIQTTEPKAVGQIAPGFEPVTAGGFAVEVAAIDATILIDTKLPRAFRANLPRMIQYRLESLSPVVRVRTETLNFPEPQLQPMPPPIVEPNRTQPLAQPLPPMEPPSVIQETGSAPEKSADPVPAPVARDPVGTLFEEIAPWLGPILMVLLLFLLMLHVLRQFRELSRGVESSGQSASNAGLKPQAVMSPEELRQELIRSRAIKNLVVRQWLEEDAEGLAELIKLLGADLIDDLKSDAALRPKLQTVAALVSANPEPLHDGRIAKVINEGHARLTGARITHDDRALSREWAFLEGIAIGGLRRIMELCSNSEKLHVVGQLSSSLRASYLEALDDTDRRDLFMGSTHESLPKQTSIDLASRLRRAADDVAHLGHETGGQAALVSDMLRALTLVDQEQLLRELRGQRPQVCQAVLESICLETTCIQVPDELIADVIHRTPIETLSVFLRSTRDDVRQHLLAHAPDGRRQAILSEMELQIPVPRADFFAARHAITTSLRHLLIQHGHDLHRLNTRALMTTSRLNAVNSTEVS